MPPDTAVAPSSAAGFPPLVVPGDYEEAAVRARIAERLFGAPTDAVRVGRYTIVDRIGAGGMGVVYSARDPDLGRLVALKLLTHERLADAQHRRRLVGEAQTLARLSHPNVVQIYEVGEHEGATFLALELIHGETLAAWQRRPERRWHEILAAYVDAARGLAAAHDVGVVHRDVKPTNILVGADGRVRVVDFGLARAAPLDSQTTTAPRAGDDASTTGVGAGTPAYMSPEQARGRSVDLRSDVFSLCVSLFEALYGRRPFEAVALRELPEGRLASSRLRGMVPRVSAVPAWVLPILVAGLEPDPRHRTADLHQLITALQAAPRRRRRRQWFAAGALGLALGGWGLGEALADPITCPALVDTLPDVWDLAGKEVVRARFLASQLPFAEDAWRLTERSLDAAVIAWSRERRASCVRTHVDRTQSAEQFDLAAECLAGQERALRELVARFAVAGVAEVTSAHALVHELGDPAVCTDTDALRRGPAPPRAPALRAQVVALRGELDTIRTLTVLDDLPEAAARADALISAAVVHGPLHAEAMYLRGVVSARGGEVDAAARSFAAAAAEAEEHRDDRLVAAILGEQTELAALGSRDPARARVYAELYGAKLRRIAASTAAQAEYLDRLGELELHAGDPDTAFARHDEASRLRTDDDPVGHARSLKGTANALAALGRSAESIARLESARDLLARELGAAHPTTAHVDFNLALSLVEQPDASAADLDRGLALLRGTLAVESRHGGPDSLGAARTRVAIAQALDLRGEREAAEAELARGLPVLRAQLTPTHDDLVAALSVAVNLRIEQRAWGPAADACSELIRIRRARGEAIPLDIMINAGEFTLRQGLPLAAAPYFDQALVIAASEPSTDLTLFTHALNGRGKVYLAEGDALMAQALFERARLTLAQLAAPSPALAAEVWWGAARALVAIDGDRSVARKLAADALTALREADPDAPELAAIAAFLASPPRAR